MMSETVRYLRLTDMDNRGTVVKQVGREFYGYENGTWKKRGLSIGYFYTDAPEFECYDVITEEEMLMLIRDI